MLSVENLNGYYGPFQVLFNVNFKVERGDMIAIVGSNGAGKTSLLKSIMNIELRKEGRITFEGKDITKLPTYKIAKLGIFYIPDTGGLYHGLTTLENMQLAAGRRTIDIDRLKEIYPEIDALLHRPADKLSGGERKIVSILRSILVETKLLLLDEPTEGVSPIVTEEIYKMLKKLNDEGKTIIVVEAGSRLKAALKYVGKIGVMRAGKLEYFDTTEKALKDLELLKKLIFI
ncbi:MAG: ATP-binding cassette domain-containing protein [Thermoprotei archaeon]|nr:ATP-binding cassette domain-containing protein [Thermoprotei archaeon]